MRVLDRFFNVGLAMYLLSFIPGTGQTAPEALSVTVSVLNSQIPNSGIQFKVEIANKTDKRLEMSTGSKVPPFTIRVVDEQGVNLNRNATRALSKNRTNKGTTLVFGPREAKTYEIAFTKYIDDDGKEKQVPPGVYAVSAALPIVSYVQGSYHVDLVHSNRVSITLK